MLASNGQSAYKVPRQRADVRDGLDNAYEAASTTLDGLPTSRFSEVSFSQEIDMDDRRPGLCLRLLYAVQKDGHKPYTTLNSTSFSFQRFTVGIAFMLVEGWRSRESKQPGTSSLIGLVCLL
jgi:hypothetical protein